MAIENLTLKQLIKVVRKNNLHEEAKKEFNIKDIKYCKKKQLLEFFKKFDNLNLNLNKEEDDEIMSNYDEEEEREEKVEIKEDVKPQEVKPVEDEPIVLDLTNIKNKRKQKAVQMPPEDPEEKKEREKAVVLLNNYYNRFPWLNNELIDATDPITKLKIVKAKLSSRNMSNLFAEHFFSVCYGAECLVNTTPYVSDYVKLEGFTQNLRAYDSTRDLLDELLIEYAPSIGDNVAMPVEVRLGMVMLAVGVQTHMQNVNGNNNLQNVPKPQIQQNINKPINPDNFNTDL